MKISILARYTRNGASSRVRLMQYLPALANAGIQAEILPFFDDAYLSRIYSARSASGAALAAYGRRLADLLRLRSADLIWVEKEVFPWLPWPIENLLLPRRIPIATDYDDAVFHRYDMHSTAVVRWALGRKFDGIMAASRLVMAGNSYLAARARHAGARSVAEVPTVVDTTAYFASAGHLDRDQLRIGWIGTPLTWSAYVEPILPIMASVVDDHRGRLSAVGAGEAARGHHFVDVADWSEEREIGQIQAMDIGIMPLDDTPWSRGKCGYKLIQYMACGLPVVASPVGVNKEIVDHGVNGFLAESEAEWREALSRLLGDADLRRRMGVAGRKKVESGYSLQVWGPRVAGLLRQAASRDGGRHPDR